VSEANGDRWLLTWAIKMDDMLFAVVFCLVAAIGVISVAFVRIGIKGITDKMIRSLFNYIMALIVSLMAVALLFVVWISSKGLVNIDQSSSGLITYLFLISIFVLILGSSLAVKKIGDMYGFRIKDKFIVRGKVDKK